MPSAPRVRIELPRGPITPLASKNGSARDRNAVGGQSLVEFAILAPVLLAILLIAVDVGRVYLGWVNLSNVARIGANFAAMNPSAWQAAATHDSPSAGR